MFIEMVFFLICFTCHKFPSGTNKVFLILMSVNSSNRLHTSMHAVSLELTLYSASVHWNVTYHINIDLLL